MLLTHVLCEKRRRYFGAINIFCMSYVIGIDEVGRGPVAGPVVVCACAIRIGTDVVSLYPKKELRDSKKLSEKSRKDIILKVDPFQKSHEVFFGIGEVSARTIDEIGISAAIKEATLEALTSLHTQGVPLDAFIFLDGSLHAPVGYSQETIIKGDEKIPEISLASIYAKDYRDTKMKAFGLQYPGYFFEKHMGYGTSAHYEALKKHGLTELHRKSFLKRIA